MEAFYFTPFLGARQARRQSSGEGQGAGKERSKRVRGSGGKYKTEEGERRKKIKKVTI